ncbi:MAG: type I phosphomannose isomerase catalytic subunit [Phycisphaeraceae bacterium]|nr:type I phosphomannose isomerase catalytic subunit [Phycisphaeraceae bacterium]
MPDLHDTPLYPLQFEPIYKEKVWGGRTMASALDRDLPGDEPIGESWELADLAATSPSGGGGDTVRSVIANGPLAGATLHELIEARGEELVGNLPLTDRGDFPILVKFLDARENLSVQVHPSPAYAAEHDDAHLKSEAWYIVEAEEDAVIYKGIVEGTDPDDFRAALEANDREAVESMMISVPVRPGDCHYLPSGTCHALGGGILVAEVQTPSDTTFRVFDWGRTGRQLHIDAAMKCIEFGPPDTSTFERRSHVAGVFTTVSKLVECEYFRMERVRMSEGYQQEVPYDQPAVWTVLEGAGTLDPHNTAEPVTFERGQTLLVPAGMDDGTVKLDADTVWLETTFPQATPVRIA